MNFGPLYSPNLESGGKKLKPFKHCRMDCVFVRKDFDSTSLAPYYIANRRVALSTAWHALKLDKNMPNHSQ